jgi:chitodextrinase
MLRNGLVYLATLCAIPPAARATLATVHIDCDKDTASVTAPGYTRLFKTNRFDQGTQVTLADGVQVGWKGNVAAAPSDRQSADPLLSDFHYFTSGQTQTLQVKDLPPGRYELTLYGYDTQYKDKQTQYAIDGNNDDLAETTLTIINKSPYNEISKTVLVDVSEAGILNVTLTVILVGGAINGFDLVPGPPDTAPPAAIATLAVTAVTTTQAMLRWTAPADDNGTGGRVTSYDVRYSTSTISEADWESAVQATGEPVPSAPGQQETFTVSGLLPSTTYYFAIKSADAASPANVSPLSNVPSATTEDPDTTPPAAVTDLSVSAVDANEITLSWTASGDDGTAGAATSYDVRYSTLPITDDATFAAATALTGLPAPKAAGSAETFTVTGLAAATDYYFAMKVADEAPNSSAMSNVLQVTTLPPDVTPPAAVADLSASTLDSARIQLAWTAPGDDANAGTAAAYDVRYSTAPINTDADFAAAHAAAGVPAPQPAGSAEQLTVSSLDADTLYYFAVKTSDNGVPANVSAISNVAAARTRDAFYGISNGFSLDPNPAGPYDPAVPGAGDVSISDISVEPAAITRTMKRHGPVYTGSITYSVTAATAYVHVWLELSTDNGATWSERRIHAVGAVGTIPPGAGRTAQWLVDGDHGNACKIRIRVNNRPATYSDLDPDNNKMPRPVPWTRYPLLERLTDRKDFNFTDSRYVLPHVDFYKSLSAGQMKAGFARVRFFHSGTQYLTNPMYFLHCCYLESMDGAQKYVILEGDSIYVRTDQISQWRDQIEAAFGIPKDHVMVMYTHVHNSGDAVEGVEIFPQDLLVAAMADAQPVEVGWFNQDMGTTHNTHRNLFTDATHATSSFSNYLYDPLPPNIVTDVLWQYDALGNITDGILDGRPWNSPVQQYFDCPLDSYLQIIVFRNVDTHAMTGIIVKFTLHPVSRDWFGDYPRCVMDKMQDTFGSGVEVMFTSGFSSNHRPLAAQHYPADLGSPRSAAIFASALEAALPTMEFRPLNRLGMVIGYDLFGVSSTDVHRAGLDPDRYGAGVQVWRLNDVYFSTLPCEAPSEQGLYIRARTSDTRHMYDAYGNASFYYYTWGRWFDIGHYEAGASNRFESFRMAQEIVRGVNILEQSVDALRTPGDANGDDHVDAADLLMLASAWGCHTGDQNFNALCDFNEDGAVDVSDLLTLARYWGT